MAKIVDFLKGSCAAVQWGKIQVKQHHGIVVPLFSLRSEDSCGIGEFPDLLPLFPWCQSLGFDVVQLLPLNDTGYSTSPYSAISACALNPVHLGLAHLPFADEDPALKLLIKKMRGLNQLERVAYKALHPLRDRFLRVYFEKYASDILGTDEFLAFKELHPWLKGYALFKALKIDTHWQPWCEWQEGEIFLGSAIFSKLEEKFEVEIAYHTFVQYLCFDQFENVKKVAEEHAIFLKGDLPILLDRESADVWLNPSLFDMQHTAGAPPDIYADNGQNWGGPLYNWEAMEAEQYRWWKERLKVASRLYHIYRIDHVVGFYRIWGIPLGEKVKNGRFFPSNPSEWISHGEKIMRMMLEAKGLLPIGEDLGTVPTEVRENLAQLGICGTKVMRWERKWHEQGQPFLSPEEYPPLGVTTVSTHDSETLQQWWENSSEEAALYAASRGWTYDGKLTLEQRRAILFDSHHTSTLFHINLLQEYLAQFPEMVWTSPSLERVNIPGIVSDENWTYRFRPSVEEIVAHSKLARSLQLMF